MTPDDPELLAAAVAGDVAAFDRFVERHEAAVYRLVAAAVGSADGAEDALQETFVAAWRGAGSFRGTGSARPWLLTIARNAVRRLHRRRVGEPAGFESLEELGRAAGWGASDAWLDRYADRELLIRALESLEAADREVLILRELDGLSNEETADALDLTLAAAKSRLHRARLRLLAALRRLDP